MTKSQVWEEFEKSEFGIKVAEEVDKKKYSPILFEAHPKGGTAIPGVQGDAYIEDLAEQQAADLEVAMKAPTGKYSSLLSAAKKIKDEEVSKKEKKEEKKKKKITKKCEILLELLKVADALDVEGLEKEAQQLDNIVKELI